MARVCKAHPILGVQCLLVETGFEIRDKPNGEVGFPGHEFVGGAGIDLQRLHSDGTAGITQVPQELRKQGDMARISHADAEVAACPAGIEILFPLRQALQHFKRRPHGADQCVCPGRGLKPPGRPHEQRVSELLPQAAEPDARSGLSLS